MNKIIKFGFSFFCVGLILASCCSLDVDNVIVEYHEDQIDDWDSRPNVELLSEIIKPTLKSKKAENVGYKMKTEILEIITYLSNEYNIYNAYCDNPIIFYNGDQYVPVIELGFSLGATNRDEIAEKIRKELPIMADKIFTTVKNPFHPI